MSPSAGLGPEAVPETLVSARSLTPHTRQGPTNHGPRRPSQGLTCQTFYPRTPVLTSPPPWTIGSDPQEQERPVPCPCRHAPDKPWTGLQAS